MRTYLGILLYGLLLFVPGRETLQAQSTRGFTYQAVARDGTGNLLANQVVSLVLDVRKGSGLAAPLYQETHSLSTNDYGLFSVVVGKGTAIVGTFSSIDWSEDDYFLGVSLNGIFLGANELEAVPYSKVSTEMRLEQLTNVNANLPALGEVLKWDGSHWSPATDVVGGGGSTYSAGAGLSLVGTVFSNTGDLNAADDITTSTSAGGDLSGTYPNPSVDGLQGVAVAATAPANGQVLKYNGSTWAPAADVNTTYTAGTGLSLSGTTFSAVDASTSNEIQTLSLVGTTLSLSNGGGSVGLPSGSTTPWTTSGRTSFITAETWGLGMLLRLRPLRWVTETSFRSVVHRET